MMFLRQRLSGFKLSVIGKFGEIGLTWRWRAMLYKWRARVWPESAAHPFCASTAAATAASASALFPSNYAYKGLWVRIRARRSISLSLNENAVDVPGRIVFLPLLVRSCYWHLDLQQINPMRILGCRGIIPKSSCRNSKLSGFVATAPGMQSNHY